jgi:hypothetical protein
MTAPYKLDQQNRKKANVKYAEKNNNIEIQKKGD